MDQNIVHPSPLAQNNAVFAFSDRMLVGGDPKERYREGNRYKGKYGPRYPSRYSVGQGSSVPTGGSSTPLPTGGGTSVPTGTPVDDPGSCKPCDPWVTGQTGAAHGRRIYYDCGQYSCPIRPPRCDCHVIGGNTLNSADFPGGVPSGTFGDVLLDSGDADFFVPYYMAIVALEVGTTANLSVTGAPVLVTLQDSKAGQKANMRRASQTDPSFGVPTLVYGQEKQLECVDWHKFASVNQQQLRLFFFNPQTVAVHIFVNLWGLAAGG